MTSSTQEKEAKFQALKQLHAKTVFAFHGSTMECWHSILRVGVKNVSKSSLMTTGAAYGPGVYAIYAVFINGVSTHSAR